MTVAKRLVACCLTLALAACLQACSQQAGEAANAGSSTPTTSSAVPESRLEITSYGPDQTKEGEPFNVQPNGSAALWVRMNQPLDGETATVEFNGVWLEGNVSGNLVTVGVPEELYAKPGTYTLRVVARNGTRSRQSNSVKFSVK